MALRRLTGLRPLAGTPRLERAGAPGYRIDESARPRASPTISW